MSDTFITIIAVMVVAVIMFVFPIMATANQNDSITQTSVQTLVSDFVNTVAKEGKITRSNYDDFIQILDDNPGAKGEENIKVIGENIYYSEFTTAIESKLNSEGAYKLKQGDYILAKVTNTNVTFGTQMKNFFYSIMGKDTIAIEASASALVTTTGK